MRTTRGRGQQEMKTTGDERTTGGRRQFNKKKN